MIKYLQTMDNYDIYQCEKGHRMKVYEKTPIPKECIICLHIEKLKKEKFQNGIY